MDHTVTLSDSFEAALTQASLDQSVSPDDFLKAHVEYALTATSNLLVAQEAALKLSAFESAKDTDTKLDIVTAISDAKTAVKVDVVG